MEESVDRNWYSPENRRKDREAAEAVLREMKELEKAFGKTHKKVAEKTPFGMRFRYVKRKHKCP